MADRKTRAAPLPRAEREARVLDAAADLFYARGVHEVGMDELVRATGLGKATVYRLYATKEQLIAAYLQRRADRLFALIDADIAAHAGDAAGAIAAIFAAIAEDVSSDDFRGCAFHNASIEFRDPAHPARAVAREYRAGLLERLRALTAELASQDGDALADRLALVVDGMYVSAVHLGPDGPAAAGPQLAADLLERARG